jgi:hypothetical protein
MATNPDVDAWFAALVHPQKETMLRVREAILATDPRIEESIKWKSPTFSYKGNIASINPQARQFVSLMFHRGGDIPGDFPSLTGTGAVARYMRFGDAAEVSSLTPELQSVVRAWVQLRGG